MRSRGPRRRSRGPRRRSRGPRRASPVRKIVLVHSAYVDATGWNAVAAAQGFHVVSVDNPLTSPAADVAVTRKVLADQRGSIILVGHSWGGVVIGEVGNDPKVKALVYIAGAAHDRGESLTDLGRGAPPTEDDCATCKNVQGYLSLDAKAFPHAFMNDVPLTRARRYAAHQKKINQLAFETKHRLPPSM